LQKPDWEKAARSFQEAAKLYATCGPVYVRTYIDACKQCAVAFEKQDAYHPAAQHYEKAAVETAKTPAEAKDAVELYRQAARFYRLGESPDKAATIYMKAANLISETDIKLATELCSDACGVFEDENRGMFANDTFKQSINMLVKHKRFADAIALLQRQCKVYKAHIATFENDLHKNYLSIIVLRFHLTEYDAAEKDYKEFCADAKFVDSNDCTAADSLIDAWRQGSKEHLAKAIKLQTFEFLANSIAVLARKLAFDEGKLKAQQALRAAEVPESAATAAASAAAAAAADTAQLPKTKTGELDLT